MFKCLPKTGFQSHNYQCVEINRIIMFIILFYAKYKIQYRLSVFLLKKIKKNVVFFYTKTHLT